MYAGYLEDGDQCPQKDCGGRMYFPLPENCSCHISPPCHACVSVSLTCKECGFADESPPETYVLVAPGIVMAKHKPRKLDNTKVDYVCQLHSSSSMVKKGVYPEGMSAADVAKEVKGTFGGRFESFGDGKFKYIAYTD